ncbi:hypothetical protein GJ496_001551 [Pomphorhynchus laevis]|nr:hypothetical protein GJ496_001551 [Pomphorhynchus laevis]
MVRRKSSKAIIAARSNAKSNFVGKESCAKTPYVYIREYVKSLTSAHSVQLDRSRCIQPGNLVFRSSDEDNYSNIKVCSLDNANSRCKKQTKGSTLKNRKRPYTDKLGSFR